MRSSNGGPGAAEGPDLAHLAQSVHSQLGEGLRRWRSPTGPGPRRPSDSSRQVLQQC